MKKPVKKAAKKKAKKPAPKIEIVYDFGMCGERIKECDFVDYMSEVHAAAVEHPKSKTACYDGIESGGWASCWFIVYNCDVEPSDDDLIAAIQKMVTARENDDE